MPVTVTVNVKAFGLGRQFGLELFDYLFFFLRIFAVRCSWKWKGKLTQVNAEHALVLSMIFKFLISRRLVLVRNLWLTRLTTTLQSFTFFLQPRTDSSLLFQDFFFLLCEDIQLSGTSRHGYVLSTAIDYGMHKAVFPRHDRRAIDKHDAVLHCIMSILSTLFKFCEGKKVALAS
jgi:hypothetical protein